MDQDRNVGLILQFMDDAIEDGPVEVRDLDVDERMNLTLDQRIGADRRCLEQHLVKRRARRRGVAVDHVVSAATDQHRLRCRLGRVGSSESSFSARPGCRGRPSPPAARQTCRSAGGHRQQYPSFSSDESRLGRQDAGREFEQPGITECHERRRGHFQALFGVLGSEMHGDRWSVATDANGHRMNENRWRSAFRSPGQG